MLAWTGRDPRDLIEFDQSQAFAMEKVATLTHAVRMLCDDLRGESSSLDHPLVRDRIASTLASALLVGLPHNQSRAFEAASLRSLRPRYAAPSGSSRRMRKRPSDSPTWPPPRASAQGHCKWPFAAFATRRRWRICGRCGSNWRAANLAQAGQDGGSVTSVANAYGLGSLSRFAAHYKARFHESPSETLRRGAVGQ